MISGELATCVASWGQVSQTDLEALSDAELVEVVAAGERVKAAAAALQCRATAALDASQRRTAAERTGRSTRADQAEVGWSVAGMVALARRVSPTAGNKHLGLATALVHEMPCTLAALSVGEISEHKALVMVAETAVLAREDRTTVDARLADQMGQVGVRRLANLARSVGYELDRESPLRRIRGAESDRRVSIRPAPQTMTWVGAFLPVKAGVAVHTALKTYAATLRGQGDPRSEGQIMADTLVARVTGAETLDQISVEVCVVMGQATCFEGSTEPGWVAGYGPVPAALARRIVRETDQAFLRRLYAHPVTGELVAMDSKRRLFTGGLRRLAVLRDDTCRTPWCDAPIVHADHITDHAHGGPTNVVNEQGLCATCSLRKNTPGWATSGSSDLVTTITPTGHTYESRPPPLPGTGGTRVIHLVHSAPIRSDYARAG